MKVSPTRIVTGILFTVVFVGIGYHLIAFLATRYALESQEEFSIGQQAAMAGFVTALGALLGAKVSRRWGLVHGLIAFGCFEALVRGLGSSLLKVDVQLLTTFLEDPQTYEETAVGEPILSLLSRLVVALAFGLLGSKWGAAAANRG
jgi:hypothetical protein